jgi:hypothetical protein
MTRRARWNGCRARSDCAARRCTWGNSPAARMRRPRAALEPATPAGQLERPLGAAFRRSRRRAFAFGVRCFSRMSAAVLLRRLPDSSRRGERHGLRRERQVPRQAGSSAGRDAPPCAPPPDPSALRGCTSAKRRGAGRRAREAGVLTGRAASEHAGPAPGWPRTPSIARMAPVLLAAPGAVPS